MDSIDLAILRAMRVLPYTGKPHGPDAVRPAALARALGLGVDRVKDRVARMERSGVAQGYEIYPNLHHLGLGDVTLHTQIPRESKKQVLEKAPLVEGLIGLYDYVGTHVCIQLLVRSPQDLERKTRLLTSMLGLQEPPGIVKQEELPSPTRELGNLDWRIIRAMRGNAKRPTSEIAAEIGVNPRTVRRRLERMTEGKDIDVVVEADFGAIPGAIMYDLRVHCPPEKAAGVESTVTGLAKNAFLAAFRPASPEFGSLELTCFAFSQGEVEAMRARIEDAPGVDQVDVLLPASGNYSGTWLDEAIDEKIRETKPTVSA